MAKDTKPKRAKQNKKATRNKQSQAETQSHNGKKASDTNKPISYYLGKAFRLLLIIAGLTGLYPLIHPDISIQPSTTSKDRDPFRRKWLVTNTGWGPVDDLKINIRPHQIVGTGFKATGPDDFSARITFNAGVIGKLSAGESTSFEVPIILSSCSTLEKADIAFALEYKAKYFPFVNWTKIQRFMPTPQKDGSWDWYPYCIPK